MLYINPSTAKDAARNRAEIKGLGWDLMRNIEQDIEYRIAGAMLIILAWYWRSSHGYPLDAHPPFEAYAKTIIMQDNAFPDDVAAALRKRHQDTDTQLINIRPGYSYWQE